MILVDSSVWIDHLRHSDPTLNALLARKRVLTHPFVIGEVALGHSKHLLALLDSLSSLPKASTATDDEVLAFISRYKLSGMGIGYIDVHLLAGVQLTPEARLWTRDKRLHTAAEKLELSVIPEPPKAVIH